MKIKPLVRALLLLIVLLAVSSCAPAEITEKDYGFFYGILHGILLPFALIGKIFNVDTGIYALNNTGTWYWLGYFLGFLIIGGSGASAKRKKR